MKLYAISDLHLDHRANREALQDMPELADDWLILGGDICASAAQLAAALDVLCGRFKKVVWVPGNHELWVEPNGKQSSVDKYRELVNVCRSFQVSTPEDDYPVWPGPGGPLRIVPLHILYDYSFRPDSVALDEAVDWAVESGVLCRDEYSINPAPYGSKAEWCQARLDYSEQRLRDCGDELPLVLVNHFPLRYDLVRTMRVPRFSIWCGTRKTEDWHLRYRASVVVSGHLHMRSTDYRDGVRFEEVSLGYPRDWKRERSMHHYLREILPGAGKSYHHAGPFWKF
ncbi:metallophosphoesterase family protein [Gilvimarinus sp. F26214L]|uniref:metallophosphoesterase family protein n=1 Tax=Gilvimarinus sp. DZF01 TaxID=3461371 RepID=UPI004045962D